jgi:hypothetical protein
MTRSVLGLLLLLCLLPPGAWASAKKDAGSPTRGNVAAVDVKANTISLVLYPGDPPVTCVVNDQTTIEVNDKSVTLKQVRKGLWIRSVRLDSSTPPVVEDLDLTSVGDPKPAK